MTVAQNVGVSLVYKAETNFGTSAGPTGGQTLRRVSSSLSMSKDSFQSNEARSDFQISDLRHGVRRVQGAIEGELSTATWDDWIEAVTRGTWAAGSSQTQAAGTSLVSATTGSLTVAAGDLITSGFRVGDVVTVTNATGAATALNSKNYVITSITGSNRVLGVYPYPEVAATSSTYTLSVSGKKVTTGTAVRSFTIEQVMGDLDISEQFLGCRIGGMSLRVPPNGMATVSWDILGQDGSILTGANSPHFTAPTAATTTGVLAGASGFIRAAGAWKQVVTGFDLSVNLGLGAQAVVGSTKVPDVFYGRTQITGNLSAYVEDASLLTAFVNESEVDIVLMLEGIAATGQKPYICFSMQRCKFSGISKQITTDDGVIAQLPFQALYYSGTDIGTASLSITRSNA